MGNSRDHQKLLFLLTDGGRARLVRFDREHREYVTVRELENQEALRNAQVGSRGEPSRRSRQGFGSPSVSGEGRDRQREAKEAFMARAADLAVTHLAEHPFQGLVVAAPTQLIGVLCREASARGAPIFAAVRKDLTKIPNHQLNDWLGEVHPAST